MPNVHLFISLLFVTTISHAALHCPHGWTEFQRSCYKVIPQTENSKIFGGWLKASRACMGYGGYLVSMTSETEKEFVQNLSSSDLKSPQSAWIGLVHRLPKGIYSWIDGSSFNHSLSVEWIGNTTSKLNGSEIKCVELLRDGWNLTECCKKTEYYICERPKGPLSCPPDHDEGHLNGLSCYYKHSTLKTWEDAKKDCIASGSNLVKINSTVNKTDTGFLTRLLDTTNFKEDIWIDQGNKSKLCGTISKTDNRKTDRDCGQSHAYLCEKPVPGKVCHCQSPGKMSFVPTEVNCSFPGSLCFKYSNKSVKDGQFTAQGCISAELCRKLDNQKGLECCHGDLCNTAISCYRCENSSSLDECQENQDDVDCPIPVHYCARIRYESRTREGKIQTTYRKGCVTKDQCNANATSGKIVDCCEGDKCNTNTGPRCYECTDPVKFEECAVGGCIFNDGKCYYSGEQYGCIQPRYCNKIAENGKVIHCCEGSLCNKVNKPRSSKVIYISVGAAVAVLLLGATIFIWCYRRRRKKEGYGSYLSQPSVNALDEGEILHEQIELQG